MDPLTPKVWQGLTRSYASFWMTLPSIDKMFSKEWIDGERNTIYLLVITASSEALASLGAGTSADILMTKVFCKCIGMTLNGLNKSVADGKDMFMKEDICNVGFHSIYFYGNNWQWFLLVLDISLVSNSWQASCEPLMTQFFNTCIIYCASVILDFFTSKRASWSWMTFIYINDNI